jgi:hypothetical protein
MGSIVWMRFSVFAAVRNSRPDAPLKNISASGFDAIAWILMQSI